MFVTHSTGEAVHISDVVIVFGKWPAVIADYWISLMRRSAIGRCCGVKAGRQFLEGVLSFALAGVPQIIHLVPFDASVCDDLELLDLSKVLDRVIIGPTQFGDAMEHAFVLALQDAGVGDARARVCTSRIPIRNLIS
jgi:hypothetical protein